MRVSAVMVSAVVGFIATAGNADAALRLSILDLDAAPRTIRVSGGCTIGFHPGPFGFCVQNGYAPPVSTEPTVLPAYAARRACRLGYHLGLFGLACLAD